MKQPSNLRNFFWFIGVVTTLNYVKKIIDFYADSLDSPRQKNRTLFFLYDHKNINSSQRPIITDTPSSKVKAKCKPGKSSGVGETE